MSNPVPTNTQETATAASNDPLAAKKQTIAKIKAQREALAAKIAEDSEPARLDGEIEDEQALLDAEQALGSQEDGKFGVVRVCNRLVILIPASEVAYKRHQDAGSTSSVALEKLVGPCLRYPTRSRFDEYVKREPATLLRCANKVTELAGFRHETFSKL